MASGAGVSRKRLGLTARNKLKPIQLFFNTHFKTKYNTYLLSVGVSGRAAIAPVKRTRDKV